jgi:hypothetical protein
VGSRSRGRLGGNADPNGDRTDDRFLSLTLGVFFILGRFVNLDLLETNNVYRCKADLEISVGKLRGTT